MMFRKGLNGPSDPRASGTPASTNARMGWKSTILAGLVVSGLAAFLPLRILAELVNIGTLLAFVIVCAAVLIMRVRHPEAERPFRAPFYPATPILGILTCLVLMFSLPPENWLRLGVWLGIGFVIYFAYSRKHSVMAQMRVREAEDAARAAKALPRAASPASSRGVVP